MITQRERLHSTISIHTEIGKGNTSLIVYKQNINTIQKHNVILFHCDRGKKRKDANSKNQPEDYQGRPI